MHFLLCMILDKDIKREDVESNVFARMEPFDEEERVETVIGERRDSRISKIVKLEFEKQAYRKKLKLIGVEEFNKIFKYTLISEEIQGSRNIVPQTPSEIFYEMSAALIACNEDIHGNEIYHYNPNGKWDWYVIGGRWDNKIIDGNICRYRDLKKKIEDTKFSERDLEELTKKFNNDPILSKQYFDSFEQFLEYEKYHLTYSLLTKDNEWLDRDSFLYFDFIKQNGDYFKNNIDLDDWLVIVDYHN